jgi:hypothetical protein
LKETSKAYMAGLIDAEGCFSISRHVRADLYAMYDPLIRFTTTHKKTADWVVKTFGGVMAKREWSHPTWKPYYQWRICNDKHASKFLSLILPYVRVKISEAKILQQFYAMSGEMNPLRRAKLFDEMTELKNRESVTTDTLNFPWKKNLINAYMGGIFDGEGSSYIVKYTQGRGGLGYRPAVSLGNTFLPLVKALHSAYGGTYRSREPHNGFLPMYEWELRRVADQEKFLLSVLPYLSIKRAQSNILLRFLRLNGEPNPAKRAALYNQIRQLNGKKIQSELRG